MDKNMSHVTKQYFIKLPQRCKDIRSDNLIKFDPKNFSETVLNSLSQTWVLHLPIGQEIATGVPHREIPNCDSPHMNESPHCPCEKANPPLALKNEPPPHLHGGRGCHEGV